MNLSSQREILIKQLMGQGIHNPAVLDAIRATPREIFVSADYKDQAYVNNALPIECRQTISQPYIVALMTQTLMAQGGMHKVLEVGTGSGYQAAVLARLVKEVYTVERIEALYLQAQKRFQQLGLHNIHCRFADGYSGWREAAPFDGIIVTAAAKETPDALLRQLADQGRLVIPLGDYGRQELLLITREGTRFKKQFIESVVFVPLLEGCEKKP